MSNAKHTLAAVELANAIIDCVEDYGTIAPSINRDKAMDLAKNALDKAIKNINADMAEALKILLDNESIITVALGRNKERFLFVCNAARAALAKAGVE